jgi:hypothetical protein
MAPARWVPRHRLGDNPSLACTRDNGMAELPMRGQPNKAAINNTTTTAAEGQRSANPQYGNRICAGALVAQTSEHPAKWQNVRAVTSILLRRGMWQCHVLTFARGGQTFWHLPRKKPLLSPRRNPSRAWGSLFASPSSVRQRARRFSLPAPSIRSVRGLEGTNQRGVHGSLIDNALLRGHSSPAVAERVIGGALPFLPNRVLPKRRLFIGQAADRLVDLMFSAEVLSSNANRARTSFRSLNMMAASQSWASISL